MVGDTGAWSSVRDLAVHLSDFESNSFRNVRQVGVVPMYMHVTLDDEILGTRSNENEVK